MGSLFLIVVSALWGEDGDSKQSSSTVITLVRFSSLPAILPSKLCCFVVAVLLSFVVAFILSLLRARQLQRKIVDDLMSAVKETRKKKITLICANLAKLSMGKMLY